MTRLSWLLALLTLTPALAARAEDGEFKTPSSDDLLSKMQAEGSWSIVMMNTPGRTITFHFGELGKRVVELKWARDRGASIGEVHQRLDDIYEEETGDFGSGKTPGGVVAKGPAAARGAQAYAEMRRTVAALNAGRYSAARSHLTLLESASGGLEGPEKDDYAAASGTLRKAHAILAGDDALKRLVRAAERGDFRQREALKAELRAYGKEIGVDLTPFVSVAGEVWEAYQSVEDIPAGEGGDLAAALKELEAAETMVQGAFRRREYVAAFQRVRSLARGLSRKDRAVLAQRLRKHAAMWNKAAANTLAFALLASLSEDPDARGQKETLLDQARWKGKQGARAHVLAKRLLTS